MHFIYKYIILIYNHFYLHPQMCQNLRNFREKVQDEIHCWRFIFCILPILELIFVGIKGHESDECGTNGIIVSISYLMIIDAIVWFITVFVYMIKNLSTFGKIAIHTISVAVMIIGSIKLFHTCVHTFYGLYSWFLAAMIIRYCFYCYTMFPLVVHVCKSCGGCRKTFHKCKCNCKNNNDLKTSEKHIGYQFDSV